MKTSSRAIRNAGLCLLLPAAPILANGGHYEDGVRLLEAKSYGKAAAAFRASAAEGNAAAERELGFMYYKGTGFRQDDAQAVAWFEKAAAHGDVKSQENLGRMYENGLSVAQSDSRSAHWFGLAAEQGHRWSQYRLGEIYYMGRGVSRDHAEAAKWWTISMHADDNLAKQWRSMIQSAAIKIPPETWEEGRRRASAWSAARTTR
jgi:uncharacterized protein